MAQGESYWIERAQSAEARIKAMEEAFKPALERVKQFKTNFGVREKDDGEIVIDFDKFVGNLGMAGALELRSIVDAHYSITGEAGEKPHIKVVASG